MYIDLNGVSIYYQEVGSGKPLILLHGWGGDVSTFWGVIPFLKDKFKIYLIDLPGFGRSELYKESLTTEDYSEVIRKFIEQKGIKNTYHNDNGYKYFEPTPSPCNAETFSQ